MEFLIDWKRSLEFRLGIMSNKSLSSIELGDVAAVQMGTNIIFKCDFHLNFFTWNRGFRLIYDMYTFKFFRSLSSAVLYFRIQIVSVCCFEHSPYKFYRFYYILLLIISSLSLSVYLYLLYSLPAFLISQPSILPLQKLLVLFFSHQIGNIPYLIDLNT